MRISVLKSVVTGALAAGLLLMCSISAQAQNRAIKGKVTDEGGQPLADAKVKIEGTDVTREFNLKTNKKGEYFQLLGSQAATYRVIVRKDGFQPAFKTSLRPEMSEEAVADFQLKPGNADQKLPFEMTDADRAEYQKKLEEQKKRQKFSAEVKAHFDKGVELFDLGQFEESLTEFDAALAIDPNQPGIIARTGDCYTKLNKNEEALAAYNKAIEMEPDDGNLYALKGVVLSRLGRTAESQEMFKKSAELDPAGAGMNFYNLGITMVNSGDMVKAAEAFKQSIEADPNYAESYYQLGMSLSGSEATFPDAVAAFKRYIEIGQKPDQVQIAKDMIPALGGTL
ncbi:MAG: tetratricopeptide repeat protein [Acidobacteriota bacterium]|jgi:tetratricopeptide (TPR) repeat protein|nr:tetratricopeptide repeat protein [Acidobacteriota bacterium]